MGVRPLHAGAEEALLEAFHPRRDPPVPFLRGLGLRLGPVVEGFLELTHLVCPVGPLEQPGRRGQGQVHRLGVGDDFVQPPEGRRGFLALPLQHVQLLPEPEGEVRRLLQFACVEVLPPRRLLCVSHALRGSRRPGSGLRS